MKGVLNRGKYKMMVSSNICRDRSILETPIQLAVYKPNMTLLGVIYFYTAAKRIVTLPCCC